MCCRRSACRRSSCTGPAIATSTSRKAAGSRAHIPGARFVELPGDDHMPWVGDQESILDEIAGVPDGRRPAANPIACSRPCCSPTSSVRPHATQARRPRLERTPRRGITTLVRKELDLVPRTRGRHRRRRLPRHVRRAGARSPLRLRASAMPSRASGSRFAPACTPARSSCRAPRCAASPSTWARVSPRPRKPGEMLVSSTVTDLVSGSGIRFEDRGLHALKDIPRQWQLFAADAVS